MKRRLAILVWAGLLLLVVGGGMFAAVGAHGTQRPEGDDQPAGELPNPVYYQDQVIVLMYHDVSQTPLNDKSLTVDRFSEQLKLMKEAGFNWITMEQYVNFMLHGGRVPNNAVLLTFDDGYASFYQYAYPLLRQYQAPATSFLIVSTVGNPKAKGVPKLNWDQVQEMHQNGISFYSHTYNSHMEFPVAKNGKRIRGVLAAPLYMNINGEKRVETHEEYLARITKDLDKANQVLAVKLGNRLKVIAFPYGDFSKDLLQVCHQLGMDVTFTVKRGINGPEDRNGYRVNAGGMSDDPAELIADMKKAIPKAVTTDCLSWAGSTGRKASNGKELKACHWGLLGPAFP
ncbi:polysaccharide deacetylase family protein [Cohnella nanjingensis]|uniref:Polysaccharide deacetylase family protein n=1 Tax=Cohnella nanjingensis TaxID=1387779 RepID=A0A7X0RVC0_9BACL|nr:polysaccharide deacetylase family protein [Cohnella nanjingensis]MBB6673156.1 polysaccharide deacetylase family protein [Cohnella nanjingensis]